MSPTIDNQHHERNPRNNKSLNPRSVTLQVGRHKNQLQASQIDSNVIQQLVDELKTLGTKNVKVTVSDMSNWPEVERHAAWQLARALEQTSGKITIVYAGRIYTEVFAAVLSDLVGEGNVAMFSSALMNVLQSTTKPDSINDVKCHRNPVTASITAACGIFSCSRRKPSSRQIANAAFSPTVRCGGSSGDLPFHDIDIYTVAFNRDGTLLTSGGRDGAVQPSPPQP